MREEGEEGLLHRRPEGPGAPALPSAYGDVGFTVEKTAKVAGGLCSMWVKESSVTTVRYHLMPVRMATINKSIGNTNLKRYVHPSVHSSTIFQVKTWKQPIVHEEMNG